MTYWERRQASEDARRAYRQADELLREIEQLHQDAQRRIRAQAQRIRQRFRKVYGLSEEKARELLASPVGREEYLKLLEEIGRLGKNNPMRDELLAKAAAPAYAHRIRLNEAMELENDAVTARMAEREEKLLEKHLAKTAQEQSLRAGFRIQHEAGVAFRFSGVSEELAQIMIRRPWSGLTFSERIWKNREALSETLNTVLREGLYTGRSGEKIAAEIAERMNVSVNRARTLVRTETTYVCNQADMAAYEEAQIERYRFDATLDLKTSKICRKHDGKVYRRKEAKVGVNCPPMHPNCRSGTVTVFSDEELARMKRWSRDPVTGKDVYVPANMTYEEWLKLQKETYGEERIAIAQKMALNEKRDERQFKAYKAMLGQKQLPKNLASFQQMKYTEPEEWEALKTYAGGVRSGEVSPLSGIANYKDIVQQVETRIVGLTTGDGLEITGYSEHFVFRTIGSVEQRRNGVTIDDTIQTLTSPARVMPGPTTTAGRSRRYVSEKAQVSVNPDTGIVIQVNPMHSRKGEKGEN